MNRLLIVLLVGIGLLACAHTVSKYTGAEWIVWNEDDLRDVAAFEMSCKPQKLSVVSLGDTMHAGVSGCGKKRTYLCDRRGVWIGN
jgi:precorrin-6B methylase 1